MNSKAGIAVYYYAHVYGTGDFHAHPAHDYEHVHPKGDSSHHHAKEDNGCPTQPGPARNAVPLLPG